MASDPGSALIVGAGYIGLEMAEALRTRGLDVTVVEQLPQVLSTVDSDLAGLIADELGRHKVQVVTGTAITAVRRDGSRLAVTGHRMPLGSTAHKQGRVAGENAVGGDRTFAGSVGTQVVKVFEATAPARSPNASTCTPPRCTTT